jgi:hypothetical protein
MRVTFELEDHQFAWFRSTALETLAELRQIRKVLEQQFPEGTDTSQITMLTAKLKASEDALSAAIAAAQPPSSPTA